MTRLAIWYDDDDYTSLKALRTAVVADLNANQLKPVIQFGMATNLPSLVVAQILYGDASRAAEIEARNDPRNPGFCPLQVEALAE